MAKIDYLLFDADETVFDFSKAERHALADLLQDYGLPVTPEVIDSYSMFNEKLWKQLEQKELERAELKVSRFEKLLAYLQREAPWHPEWELEDFDWAALDSTEMNERFIDHLSRQSWLMPDAEPVLKELQERWTLVLVTNGIRRAQEGRLAGSTVADCFTRVFVSEAVGFDKPDGRFFDAVCEELGVTDRSRMLLIGDSPTSDLQGGFNAGIPTIWYNPWTRDLPQNFNRRPDHEIRSLREMPRLLNVLDPAED